MPEVGPIHRASRMALLLLAAYALVGGLISFIAYPADLPRLADWLNSGISIQPNTAIAVVAAALGLLMLWGHQPHAAVAFGLVVIAIGGSVLFQHASGLDLGVDALFLFGREWGNARVVVPGRMGPPGAISWTLIGLAMILASLHSHERLRAFAPASALVAKAIATPCQPSRPSPSRRRRSCWRRRSAWCSPCRNTPRFA
jgi:hypothetical protein